MRRAGLPVLLAALACSAPAPELAPADRSAEPVDFDARHEPAGGAILHGWGQFSGAFTLGLPRGDGDAADLAAYERAVAPAAPALLSFYVAPVAEQREGLLGRLASLQRERGPFVALVGLWFHAFQAELASGGRDAELHALAAGLRQLELPVLLRIGYEFNNPWQAYDPQAYTAAFRRVAAILREEHASNVATLWHASALGLASAPPARWYPGDDVVDWWGVSLFHFEELASPALATFLDDAREHRRPVAIGEAAPVLSSRLPARVRGPASEAEALRWYTLLFELVRRRPELKALALISVDWRRLEPDLPGSGWPDTRLATWPGVAVRVRTELAQPRWIQRADLSAPRAPGEGW